MFTSCDKDEVDLVERQVEFANCIDNRCEIKDEQSGHTLVVNSLLFDTELFQLPADARFSYDQLSSTISGYFQAVGYTYDTTGYPVWGAAVYLEDYTLIPALRSDQEVSHDFFLFQQRPNVAELIVQHVNVLQNYDVLPFVQALTDRISVPGRLEGRRNTHTITGIFAKSRQSKNPRQSYLKSGGAGEVTSCDMVTVAVEQCISAGYENDPVGTLCCNCSTEELSFLSCGSSGGGNGGGPGVTSGGEGSSGGGSSGGGGTPGGGTWSPYPGMTWAQYVSFLKRYGPDNVINEVDCEESPCLCASINRFEEGSRLNAKNLSNEVSLMIYRLFGAHTKVDFTITTSAQEKIQIPLKTLATHVNTAFPIDGGIISSTITYNSRKNMNCTEAHLSATLIHEAMHAYIEQQKNFMSSTEFAQTYPLYSSGTNQEESHHIVMANTYVEMMSRSLRSMYPDMPENVAVALSWEGLHLTKAYGALSPDIQAEVELYTNMAKCNVPLNSPPVHPATLASYGLKPLYLII